MLGVWTSSSIKEGGLEFSSIEIGMFFVSWGFYLLPYFYFIWPRMINHIGKDGKHIRAWYVIRFGLFLAILEFCFYPFLNTVANNRIVMWVLLELVIILGVIAINTYSLALHILINNSVSVEINGSINGLITLSLALGKAIAPLSAGLIFTWSLSQTMFPIDFHFLFFILAFAELGILLATILSSYFYPTTLNIRVA